MREIVKNYIEDLATNNVHAKIHIRYHSYYVIISVAEKTQV